MARVPLTVSIDDVILDMAKTEGFKGQLGRILEEGLKTELMKKGYDFDNGYEERLLEVKIEKEKLRLEQLQEQRKNLAAQKKRLSKEAKENRTKDLQTIEEEREALLPIFEQRFKQEKRRGVDPLDERFLQIRREGINKRLYKRMTSAEFREYVDSIVKTLEV